MRNDIGTAQSNDKCWSDESREIELHQHRFSIKTSSIQNKENTVSKQYASLFSPRRCDAAEHTEL